MLTQDEARRIIQTDPAAAAELLVELSAANEALQKRVAELERKVAQLAKNSANSGKPPSSDDLTKPPRKNKAKGKRKIGAQPGHPKHERQPFDKTEIDWFHEYALACCPHCGGKTIPAPSWEPQVVQQVELKPAAVSIEEHRATAARCERCHKIYYAPFPPAVERAGLFKENLTALVAYLKYACHASFSTIRRFILDVLRLRVSRGYLCKVIQKVSRALRPSYEELLERLPLEWRINVDETGHRENGERFWTWVFRADLYVLFKIDKSRGSKVLLEVLGREFNGVLGCDYFSAYRKYMKDFSVEIQFCLAHLIRNIKFLLSLPDAATRAYGQKLLAALKALFTVIHRRETLGAATFQAALEKARRKILRIGIEQAPSRLDRNGKEQNNEAQNMADRLRKHGAAYFSFITTPGIDPTNNVAEQAIRFVVIDRVVTQGTRGLKGRTASERLWTVIATCRLQKKSTFDFLLDAVRASFHNLPPPSLLPRPCQPFNSPGPPVCLD
jgi:transposase